MVMGANSAARDVDLVSNQDLCAGTLPAPCAGGTEHEATGGIDVEAGDDTCARGAGDDEKGHGRVFEGARLSEIVETENIVGGTGEVVSLLGKET